MPKRAKGLRITTHMVRIDDRLLVFVDDLADRSSLRRRQVVECMISYCLRDSHFYAALRILSAPKEKVDDVVGTTEGSR